MGAPATSERYPDTGFSVKDTSPEVNQMVFDRMMALSGAERLIMGCDMFDSARAMVMASIPDGLSETEQRQLFFKRVYGTDLESLLE